MFKNLKVGIIGSEGNFGKKRTDALELNNVKVIFFADPQIKATGSKDGCIFTNNIDEVFTSEEVDLIFIATPDQFKEQFIRKGLTSKKHIFVEKPLSKDVRAINSFFKLANKHNKLLTVGYNLTYFPSLKKLLGEIKKRPLGKLIGFRFLYGHGGGKKLEQEKNWRLSSKSWGGVEVDLGCHIFELLYRLGLRSIDNISNHDVRMRNKKITVQRSSNILGNKGTVAGSIFTSWYCWKNTFDINLWFENGYIYSNGLLKYLKYGQLGERLEIGLKQEGAGPKIKTFLWNQNLKDSLEVFNQDSIELEFTDLEIKNLIHCLRNEDLKVLNSEERNKNIMIAEYLSS